MNTGDSDDSRYLVQMGTLDKIVERERERERERDIRKQ